MTEAADEPWLILPDGRSFTASELAVLRALSFIKATCQRTEAKVDALIDALAEDETPAPQTTLEGGDAGRERDQGQSLDADEAV